MFDVFGDEIVLDEMKRCALCGILKHDSLFHRANGATYARYECAECKNDANRLRAKMRKVNKPPGKDYTCPICLGTEEVVKGRGGKNNAPWCCDHDHETKLFRGYLCHSCNRALGSFKDNVENMKRAIEWLEK